MGSGRRLETEEGPFSQGIGLRPGFQGSDQGLVNQQGQPNGAHHLSLGDVKVGDEKRRQMSDLLR